VIALDRRETNRMSLGMKSYARELRARLPRIAPDLDFIEVGHGDNYGWDESVWLPREIRRRGAALTHYLCLHAPVIPPRPFVITIHDLIHLRFPQWFEKNLNRYYHTVIRFQLWRAARLITDDERTVEDFVRFLGVRREKIRTIPLGVAEAFFRPAAPHDAPRPYFLYVGNHYVHKDLPTLARAWAALPSQHDVDLYITGRDDLQELQAEYRRERGSIVVLGHVDETALVSYYAGATALVHAAFVEGFGLPLLEAMAQGCAVVACRDAIPAVLKDAAFAFAPTDWREAAAHMERLLVDPELRRAAIARGRTIAAPYTWDRCASRTADVYREVLAERAGGARAAAAASASP
jgi:glycosyltransferase involved in cell wall biosynthesis